jgi:alkylation response protein AidB-like acyl-CoA dehydrogenase
MAKLFCTELAADASLEAMRILGGYAYSREYMVDRSWAPVLILGAGSNEILQALIARQLKDRYLG